MNTQTFTQPAMTCNFLVEFPVADFPSEKPIYVSSRDYGFDFDEDEIAREMLAPLPADLCDQPSPTVGAEEFEKRYVWSVS